MSRELKLKLRLSSLGLIKLLISSLAALSYLSTIIARNSSADLLLLYWAGLHPSDRIRRTALSSGIYSHPKSKPKLKIWFYQHSSVPTNWSWRMQQTRFPISPSSKSREESGWTLQKFWQKIPNIKILTSERHPSSQLVWFANSSTSTIAKWTLGLVNSSWEELSLDQEKNRVLKLWKLRSKLSRTV